MQLPAQEALQSALKLLQQSFSPAHHESHQQPLGACEKQIPEHSPAAAGRTSARAKTTTRVKVIALPRFQRLARTTAPNTALSTCRGDKTADSPLTAGNYFRTLRRLISETVFPVNHASTVVL